MIGIALVFAWGVVRTTAYTITNRRVVMRFGIALSMTVNLPYTLVASAAAKLHADGSGDVSIALLKPHRISYIFFWPHARPWHLLRPQPTLRGIAEAGAVAQILARALAGAASVPVQAMAPAGAKPGNADMPSRKRPERGEGSMQARNRIRSNPRAPLLSGSACWSSPWPSPTCSA